MKQLYCGPAASKLTAQQSSALHIATHSGVCIIPLAEPCTVAGPDHPSYQLVLQQMHAAAAAGYALGSQYPSAPSEQGESNCAPMVSCKAVFARTDEGSGASSDK